MGDTSTNRKRSLAELNAMSRDTFVACLGGVFEHSPWIPERAWSSRPFASIDALHADLVKVLDEASEAEQRALIRAHPELAGKEASAGTLTAESTGEQRGAGLDQCSPEELQRLQSANAAYQSRFGFPFVIAVKGLDRAGILAAVETRLHSTPEAELHTSLEQICRIARFRLDALIDT